MLGIVPPESYSFDRLPGTGTSPWTARSRSSPGDSLCRRTQPRLPCPGCHAPVMRRRAEVAAARRKRRLAGLVFLASVALVTLLLTAFGSGRSGVVRTAAPAPAARLLPAGPPSPQVVALQGTLRLQLPVAQSRVTEIGYHASGNGALTLDPVGRQ